MTSRFGAIVLATLAIACPRRRAPRADAGVIRAASDAAPTAIPTDPNAWISRLPSPPALTPTLLTDESPREPAPSPPPGCTNRAPFQRLELPSDGPASFVVAASRGRRMLSVLVASGRNDAGAMVDGDSATWLYEPDRPGARFARGPIEPLARSLVASGGDGVLVVAWARPADDERGDGDVRAAVFAADASAPRVFTLAHVMDPDVTDLTCLGAACSIAYSFGERYGPADESDRGVWAAWAPGEPLPVLRRVAPRESVSSLHALAASAPADAIVGSFRTGAQTGWMRANGAREPIAGTLLDAARVGDTLWALTANAPSRERCQPGAWRIRLHHVRADGTFESSVDVATNDARPRGARIRAIEGDASPMVTWLDAPQCAERFFVVRAWRAGRTAAVATAEDYDIATTERRVTLVVRHGARLRWLHAECPP